MLLGALLALSTESLPLLGQTKADLVFRHASVITMNDAIPRASAFAVSDGRFLFVGSDPDLDAYTSPQTRIIDLGGATVLPGLIDAHLHPVPEYPAGHRLHQVNLGASTTPDIETLIARLARQADARPAGDWVIGRGYEDTVVGRHPDRVLLDQISLEHPIFITHSSGHRAVANSLALARAGITKASADPAGGSFVRDDAGELTGVLLETAMGPIRQAQDVTPSVEEAMAGVELTLQRFANLGLTTIVDATPYPSAWLYPVYEALKYSNRLPVRVIAMVPYDLLGQLDIGALPQDDRLSVGPVKVFHGNSLSGRTAWLSESYVGRPNDFGIPPARSQAELDEVVQRIHALGMQAAIHSNGDLEIDMVLSSYERLGREARSARHRIEHASVMNAKLLERARSAGIVLALHSYVFEHGDKMEDYGAWRWDWMHANRTALDVGIVVAGNSDYPVSGADPLLRFRSLLTRTARNGKVYGRTQRISFADALGTYTQGAAYSVFKESERGSIEPGKLADFVVLGQDPGNTPVSELQDIPVLSTWIGGTRVDSQR